MNGIRVTAEFAQAGINERIEREFTQKPQPLGRFRLGWRCCRCSLPLEFVTVSFPSMLAETCAAATMECNGYRLFLYYHGIASHRRWIAVPKWNGLPKTRRPEQIMLGSFLYS